MKYESGSVVIDAGIFAEGVEGTELARSQGDSPNRTTKNGQAIGFGGPDRGSVLSSGPSRTL